MDTTRYKRFCQQLDLDKFNNNVDQACLFYFRLLQELQVQAAYTKSQVENLKSIIGSQAKLHPNTGKSYSQGGYIEEIEAIRRHQIEGIISQSKEQQVQQFRCDYRGCQEVYDKNSRLSHHKMLKHKEPPIDLNQNRVFRVEIRDSTNENRRPTRF